MSISETKTLDYLFIQTLFAITKWPQPSHHPAHGHAFPFFADKWQELIELQWNVCVYLVDARMCCVRQRESLQMHLAVVVAATAVAANVAIAKCVMLLTCVFH